LKSASFALHEAHDGSSLDVHINAPGGFADRPVENTFLPAKDANPPAFVPPMP